MTTITINLPEKYVNAIAILVESNKYDNRSDAIRVALKNFLKKEIRNNHELNNFKTIATGGFLK